MGLGGVVGLADERRGQQPHDSSRLNMKRPKTTKSPKNKRATKKRSAVAAAPSGSVIRERYTAVRPNGRKYSCFLKVDTQSFKIAEDQSKVMAEWFRDMLTIALERVISQNVAPSRAATTQKEQHE